MRWDAVNPDEWPVGTEVEFRNAKSNRRPERWYRGHVVGHTEQTLRIVQDGQTVPSNLALHMVRRLDRRLASEERVALATKEACDGR